ncbi:hypothetical protein [Aestuariivivens sediminicola]|uniref:hypothetical protein n=1 Tax=Aestuariivivens sediminicola TaxID=2913560 RepID=UPI001F568A16|nr:hypothetical protein [Aestuariivivens sediminicola]
MNPLRVKANKNHTNAYILSYCANANFAISKDEAEFIKNKTSVSNLSAIQCAINKNTDYQTIDHILNLIVASQYTRNDKKHLIEDLKELVNIGKDYNLLKYNTFRALKYFLRS